MLEDCSGYLQRTAVVTILLKFSKDHNHLGPKLPKVRRKPRLEDKGNIYVSGR